MVFKTLNIIRSLKEETNDVNHMNATSSFQATAWERGRDLSILTVPKTRKTEATEFTGQHAREQTAAQTGNCRDLQMVWP